MKHNNVKVFFYFSINICFVCPTFKKKKNIYNIFQKAYML